MRRILKVLHLTVPAMVSSVFGIITILFCTRILGENDDNNYYLLAVFLPVNYVLLAISEAIRAASFTLSAPCKQDYNEIAINILSLTITSLFIFGVILIGFSYVNVRMAGVMGVSPQQMDVFCDFSVYMIIAWALNCIFGIFSSTFFTMKKPVTGMMVGLIACTTTCFLTCIFSSIMTPSWLGYIIGIIVSCFLLILFSLLFLSAQGVPIKFNLFNNCPVLLRRQSLIIKTSLPVLLAYLAVFSSLFFINGALSNFDNSVLTGFSIAYRIQNIAILPAITLGTAIAILSSQARANNDFEEERSIQIIGFGGCLLLYTFITIIVFYYRYYLMSLVISEEKFISAGATYLKYVSLTYITLGPNLAYLTYLEQSGAGLKSLIINIFYFVITVGIGCFSAVHYHQYTYLYSVISLINFTLFVYFITSFFWENRSFFTKKCISSKDVSYA